ncbi:AraC family transcriptional regulator [uncultured Kordia sp.]|uniref:helix-turn-helix domain-containing protein n=1 Tax=uncultured Kordia sp. TaxID=507699 RepID=UPI00262283B6|nr:AraC family transcriptional regulator [uncultured Kordia sp.]
MKQLVLLLFIAFLSVANAQEDVSFDKLVQSYYKTVNEDASKALEYILQAKSLAVVSGNPKQLAKVAYCIANCKLELEQNKVALAHIESAIVQAISLNDTLLEYKGLSLKGIILSELGEDSKALIAHAKARAYVNELKNPIYEVATLTNIANIKKRHKDFEEAIILYKDVLKLLSTLNDPVNVEYYRLLVLMHMSDTYLWLQNTKEAALYNEAGLKMTNKKNASAYYPLVMNKAIIKYQEGAYKQSVKLSKLVELYAKGKKEDLYLTSLFYLGKNAYKLKSNEECIEYLGKAYAIMKASDDVSTNEKELHEFLMLAYHETGNSEKELYHIQQYRVLEKKQSAEDLKINNETHTLIDIVPLKTENNLLEEQLTQETKSKKGFVMASVTLLILLISSVLYLKIRNKRIRKKFDTLLQRVSTLENDKKEKIVTQKDTVSDEKVHAILKRLTKFEKNEAYLSQECSLGAMAEEFESNTAYLSKVINTHKGKSFTAYITELRIETALVKLKNNKTLQSYTIMAIADEFGFKRQETFSRAFKAYTGIYPSQYIRNLKEKG